MRVIVSGRRARGLGGLNRKVLFYAMGAVREHVGGVYLMGTLGQTLFAWGWNLQEESWEFSETMRASRANFPKGND